VPPRTIKNLTSSPFPSASPWYRRGFAKTDRNCFDISLLYACLTWMG